MFYWPSQILLYYRVNFQGNQILDWWISRKAEIKSELGIAQTETSQAFEEENTPSEQEAKENDKES